MSTKKEEYFARLVVVVLESFRYAHAQIWSEPHFSIHLNTDEARFGGKLPPKTNRTVQLQCDPSCCFR
ncbi:MAG: hypothetical protein KME54_14620 [Tolypothrix brevis GSE-NOS-MK-07-07A]|nr:hypothetical protein [Tolypothrix brevis GSE-NOS-MK-07-07A]